MCSAPKYSYLSRRIYSDTSAALIEARVSLTSNCYCCYYSEQPVNVSELLKSPARNTKANYE